MNATTAIYPNRQADKIELEKTIGLSEFGNDSQEFVIGGMQSFAVGYNRIVYGDHGPYIEFAKENIKCELKPRFPSNNLNELPEEHLAKFYYYWCYPINLPYFKVYLQIKPVSLISNAPKRDDGKPSRFNREEGYADYRRGYYYVNPYQFEWLK